MTDCNFQIMNLLYMEKSIQYTYRCEEHIFKKNKPWQKTTTEVREGKKFQMQAHAKFWVTLIFSIKPPKNLIINEIATNN